MNLDPTRRTRLVDEILLALREAAPSSEAILRGSLAGGHADAQSDIDVLWEVPDADFLPSVGDLREILARVRSVESFRSDPDLQGSAKHRLFFIRFADVPLFWRLDLEVFARSAGRDPDYDLDNPDAKGSNWSTTESALANAIAAVKAHVRHDDREASALLDRAYQRVNLPFEHAGLATRILTLVERVGTIDPLTRDLGGRIRTLVSDSGLS